MDGTVHIGEAAQVLGVTPEHLRALERAGRIPPARRDFNGRIYSPFDIALLRSMGIGTRPRRLREVDQLLEGGGMSTTHIVYTPHPDATPETQATALASTYRYLLNHHAKKEAAHPGGPDDAAEGFPISENEKGGVHVEL